MHGALSAIAERLVTEKHAKPSNVSVLRSAFRSSLACLQSACQYRLE